MIDVKRSVVLAFVIFAVLMLAPAGSIAEPVGSFVRVEGDVDLLRANAAMPVIVRPGDPVSMGDAIRTKRTGKAEIQFRDETVIHLAPETRISIDQYSFGAGDSRERGLLNLFRGKIRAIVSKVKAAVVSTGRSASFSIKTPTAIAGVKGTDFIVYHDRGATGIIFIEGSGFAFNPYKPGAVVNLRAGQAAFVTGAKEPPTRPRSVTPTFIAPHLRDTTVGATRGKRGGAGGEQGGQVIDTAGFHFYGGQGEGPGQGNGPAGNLLNVQPPTIPISESHPELITTKAKVNATFQ